jgi:hypothetical protein
MTDVIGQVVYTAQGTSQEGINMIEMDLSSVAKGVYMLNVTGNGSTQQIRVVVE